MGSRSSTRTPIEWRLNRTGWPSGATDAGETRMPHAIEINRGAARVRETSETGRIRTAYDPPPADTFWDLANALRKEIEGEVRFDNGSRALYATDASNYRQVPIGVVVPRTVEDVV